jgi:hypothetical protein
VSRNSCDTDAGQERSAIGFEVHLTNLLRKAYALALER